jgi:hypothetical protein
MTQSLPSEVLRFILRLFKEIRESKWQIIYLAVIIRISNGSYTSFWSTLTQSPTAPFVPRLNRAFVLTVASLGAQCIAILLMWRLFRRRQIHLLSPWKDVDTRYIVQLLPEWSALRELRFLVVRLGPQRSSVIRAEPWHFKQTLVLAYVGSILWAATKRGGLEALFTEVHNTIQRDLCHLILQQAKAAFGQHHKSLIPALDYRHKPRFAWAAVFQVCALLLPLCSASTKSSSLSAVLSYTVPVTSVATLLLYATYGHDPDYLNASMLDRGAFEERTSVFCETCKNTAISSPKIDNMPDEQHHLTTASLQRSAEGGCRICATLWERRTRILKDFVKDLKYWEPATTYARYQDSLVFNFKQDPKGAQQCRFRICKAQGE